MEMVERMEESYIHLWQSKSMDQIQQNFITPTNHKKNWGYFWWGIFEIGTKTKKLG
mgnify:CR=1 FL=1